MPGILIATITCPRWQKLSSESMRLIHLVLGWALAITSLVVGDASERWSEIAASSSSNIIRLDDQTFDQLVTIERNYTAIGAPQQLFPLTALLVTFTALTPKFQCALCKEFAPEFRIVANSWRNAHPRSDGVFFGLLDVEDGRKVFLRVSL